MGDVVRRVAIVSPSWPPGAYANGIVTYVQYLRSGLSEHGVESRVAAYNLAPGGEDAALLNGTLSRSNAAARLATRAAWRLFPRSAARSVPILDAMHGIRRLERDWPFDVLETEESFGTAKWIARAVTAPVVVRLHGPWIVNGTAMGVPHDAAFRARVLAEGHAIATAAAVTAPCREVIEQVRRYYGLELPNAVVIPNPGPEPSPGQVWDREAAEPGHVVFIGRFDRHKGGDIAVDAFSLLAERVPSLKFTMAGPDRGVVDESGRRWSLPEYVAAKVPGPHRGRIEFVGQVSHDALTDLRRRASVVISAARYENFPMAVLEAMSQGCPVVCPDAGGLPEMVEDGVSGLVFPAGDAAALADRIESLIAAPARAAEFGAMALRRYHERYLPQRVAERTLEFYRAVCREHPARRRGRA